MPRIGSYEVQGELGRGAVGTVYRAHDPRVGRDVAIKLLPAGASPAALRRYQQEAHALARLRHRNILPIHEVGALDGRPYLVLGLAGPSLGELLRRQGPLDPRAAVGHAAKLARALDHVHRQGVLHRDVKPDNVLTLEGEPLLADFGLTKDLLARDEHLSQTGHIMGSPGFWSPEQASGKRRELGPATDLYSLGATLYALLTGEPPCGGDSLQEIALATLNARPLPPSKLRAGIDPALDEIVLRCLEKAPGDRPPGAAALADELEAYLAGEERPRVPRLLLGVLGVTLALLALLALSALVSGEGAGAPAEGTDEAAPEAPAALAPPTDWVALAKTQLDRAEYPAADESLRAAFAAEPQSVAAHVVSCQRWLELERLDEARADVTRALGLDPQDPAALVLRGELHLAMGEESEALAVAERVVALAPRYAGGYRLRSRAQGRLGLLPEALEDARQAVGLAPDDPRVLLALVEALLQSGSGERALSTVERVLARQPGFPRALALRVRAHLLLQDKAAALEAADEHVALHPELAGAHLLRALVHLQRGEPALANRDADAAVRLAPGSPRAHAGRAAALQAKGDLPAARAEFDRALAIAPALQQVRLDRALLHVNRQDFAAAQADYDRLLEDDPDQPLIYSLRAAARIGVGDHEGATADYYEHLRRTPDDATAWRTLAILQTYRGNPREALAAYDRALEIEPSAPTLCRRAALRAQLGDPAGAQDDARRALALDPDSEEAEGLLDQLAPE